MPPRRKIITYIAMSADGFIARPDGDVEWLHRRARLDYGIGKFYKTIDTILWGRGTYDWLLAYYRKRGDTKTKMFDTNVKNYVFTHRPPRQTPEGVAFVQGSVKAFARRLRATPGRNIWMMGGGGLIAAFLDAGEIDEFHIHVIPILLGKGIPLVAPRRRDISLELLGTTKYKDGVMQVRYGVTRPRR